MNHHHSNIGLASKSTGRTASGSHGIGAAIHSDSSHNESAGDHRAVMNWLMACQEEAILHFFGV